MAITGFGPSSGAPLPPDTSLAAAPGMAAPAGGLLSAGPEAGMGGPSPSASSAFPVAAQPGAPVDMMLADGSPVRGVVVATDPDLGLIHVQIEPMASAMAAAAPAPASSALPPTGGAGGPSQLEMLLSQLGRG